MENINIFSRSDCKKILETLPDKGIERSCGLVETYSWHGVSISFMSSYPSDDVSVSINGEDAADYFGIDDNLDFFARENAFWNTPAYIEETEKMFLGEYYGKPLHAIGRGPVEGTNRIDTASRASGNATPDRKREREERPSR